MNKFKLLLAAGLFALAGSASAVPIEGDILFGGEVTSFDTTTNSVVVAGTRALVTGTPTGTFAAEGIVFGSVAVYNSFDYDPLAVISPLWSLIGNNSTFKFDLQQITFIDESVAGALQLRGSGIMSYTGFDNTLYDWSFSIDSTNKFAFSATNSAVPEPGIALLPGIGLIGFGVTRKVRKSA